MLTNLLNQNIHCITYIKLVQNVNKAQEINSLQLKDTQTEITNQVKHSHVDQDFKMFSI